jgi:uncharacterized protein (DUF4213/DUF364 family)
LKPDKPQQKLRLVWFLNATTMANDSLTGLMPQSVDASFVGIMGPTAGCRPDALFDLGIHAVATPASKIPNCFYSVSKRYEMGRRHA